MDKNRTRIYVTAGAVIAGSLVVALWLLLPPPFSVRQQAPVTSKEFFLIKVETETDNMRMLLALKTHMGFIEAQDPAERIRDLCFEMDKEGYKRWSAIVDDINAWYRRLVVQGTASLGEVLGELYAKYPFLKLEGVEVREYLGDMIVKTPAAVSEWSTSSVEWGNIPGLLVRRKLEKRNVFVIFEGDMVLMASQAGERSGSIRLLVNGEERDVKELRAVLPPGGASDPESVILKWRGELPDGEYTIQVQAKVGESDTRLASADADVPKLVLIQ